VIALIFSYFRVPAIYQHRVLFWGVLGALVMRGVMIAVGAALIERFQWILYFFGAFLIFTAIKMLLAGDEEPHVERNPVVRLARRFLPVSKDYDGQKFFTRIAPGEEAPADAPPVPTSAAPAAPTPAPILPPGVGRWAVTPMFLVLLVIEVTDVVFAVDSIPAIFGITTDAFIVFTSNVFAILGLRSLYFALAALLDKFRYLKISLVFVLVFIGAKMILEQWFGGGHTEEGEHKHLIPIELSLGIILVTLLVGVAASMLKSRSERSEAPREEIP
jgi:tellurite resistance protein TerC